MKGVGTVETLAAPDRPRLASPRGPSIMNLLIPICSALAVGLWAAVVLFGVLVPILLGLFAGRR